ncbi:MAG: hypothetical protein NTV52_12200 [Acidobacteria bacterium]|nr:hypothetical protein [Acidobacteriota bacterium]
MSMALRWALTPGPSSAGDVIFGGDGLIDGGAGFRGEPEVAVGIEETVLGGEGQTERQRERQADEV